MWDGAWAGGWRWGNSTAAEEGSTGAPEPSEAQASEAPEGHSIPCLAGGQGPGK